MEHIAVEIQTSSDNEEEVIIVGFIQITISNLVPLLQDYQKKLLLYAKPTVRKQNRKRQVTVCSTSSLNLKKLSKENLKTSRKTNRKS